MPKKDFHLTKSLNTHFKAILKSSNMLWDTCRTKNYTLRIYSLCCNNDLKHIN